ncbi:NusG domain II-containing protein [Saccharibacillus sp. CPCC 101409]|uniref:NusG domain II-containing protein n=1 Tax=Saccharibacillus sp. CPCC 101409 TaxID=3058041 RepID=UPI002670E06B|nr:NusG domain II-containing protein [Saccharibacillus sp. CPCC 101409]MDO3409480.1 NusG domain II-containing protein [Saccharibacillus sp. CPCC 101409]
MEQPETSEPKRGSRRPGARIKRGDLILIAAILLLAGSVLGWQKWREAQVVAGERQLVALITVDGKEYERVPLTKEERIIDIRTDLGHNTLKVYDYGIRMIYSDAPKRIALDMGFISKPRQQIVCVPTRVMVEVLPPSGENEEEDGLDGVVGFAEQIR